MFVGLVWLTSNHKFGSDNFWDKSPSRSLKNLKLPSFYSGSFKMFKNALGQFIPSRLPKHVITRTNLYVKQNIWYFLSLYRSSHGRCSVKKGVLKYFANFTGKHLCLSLFSIMLIKKRLQRGCFPVKFANFLRAPVLKNICKRLLLPWLF